MTDQLRDALTEICRRIEAKRGSDDDMSTAALSAYRQRVIDSVYAIAHNALAAEPTVKSLRNTIWPQVFHDGGFFRVNGAAFSWLSVCPLCGVTVHDKDAHIAWHGE